MGRLSMSRRLFSLMLLILATLPVVGPFAPRLSAQGQQKLPRADTVVKPQVYVSLEPVPRERTFEVAVVARIQEGFHINANKVLEEYLIPTSLTPELPAGLKLVEAKYPQGKQLKFEFSDTPLNVYDGTVTLRLKLEATAAAPLGRTSLPVTLRYQACNDVACLPPVKLPLTAELEIAPAGAKAVAVNQKVFLSK